MSLRNDEFTIRCMQCNIDILDICHNKNNITAKIRVKCPKCNDLSFFYKISSDFGIVPCNNLCVTNVIEENNVYIIEVQ